MVDGDRDRDGERERKMVKLPLRLPEFHGDPAQFPEESWAQYEMNLELAYKVAGIKPEEDLTEEQRAAHLLQGLQGKARKFLEYTPSLHTKSLNEIKTALQNKFGRHGYSGLINMGTMMQKPGEMVIEYLARLRVAAEGIMDNIRNVTIMDPAVARDDPDVDPNNTMTEGEYKKELAIYEKAKDVVVLAHFKNGLRPEILAGIASIKPRTLAAAVKAAEEYEAYLGLHDNYSAGRISLAAARDDIVYGVSERLKNLNKNSFQRNKPDRVAPIRRQENNRIEGIICHYCRREGHYQRDCRQKKKDQENDAEHRNKGSNQADKTSDNKIHNRVPRNAPPAPPLQPRMPNLRSQGSNANNHQKRDSRQPGKSAGASTWINQAHRQKNGERPPPTRGGLKIPTSFSPQQKQW
jgi:hypothetical protein